MWPFFPKKCNCPSTPTNPNINCNHEGLTASDLVYQGEDIPCAEIYSGMDMSEVLQRIDYYLCGLEFTQQVLNIIEENPQEFNEFITLVNGAINCETINDCGPVPTTTTTSSSSSTTTTTTTISEFICFCIFIEGEGCGSTIELPILGNAPFQNGRPVYNFTGDVNGSVYYDGSQWVFNNTEFSPLLQPLDNSNYYPIGTSSEWGDVNVTGLINSSTSGPCPITTTTTSSTSTSTSTSSTTTSTTTVLPTTTTTTTIIPLSESLISSISNVSDACLETLDITCYISNIGGGIGTETITVGSVVYLDNLATTPFIGNDDYYRIRVLSSSLSTSSTVDSLGVVGTIISVCP